MLQALARNVASIDERLVLLAPAATSVTNFFRCKEVDADRHDHLVHEVQRFRGRIYAQDGAIARTQLLSDGRHQTPDDDKGWHMLLLDKAQQVSACALYREHDYTVALEDLRVQRIPLARRAEWRPKVLKAITDELARARRHHLHYVELGGWAVAPECRRTSGPLTMALAVYGFSREGWWRAGHGHRDIPTLFGRDPPTPRRVAVRSRRHDAAAVLRSSVPVHDGDPAFRFTPAEPEVCWPHRPAP
jgi:hypothetical protein